MLKNRRVLPFDKKLNDEDIQKETKRREVQRSRRRKALDAKRKEKEAKAKTKDKVQDEEIIQLTEDEIKVLKKVLPNLVALIEGEVEVEIELDESEFDIELEVDKDQFDQLTNEDETEDDKLEDQDELGKIISDPKKKEALKEVLNDSDDKKLKRLERRKAGDSAIEPLKLKDEVKNRINNKIQDEEVVKPDFTTRFEESINKLNDESTVKEQVDFSSRWN